MKTLLPKKSLSTFSLAMMNIVIVGSLQVLTANAVYGYTLLFFYAIAIITFFIPTILMTAELATTWPITGGAYIWAEQAFGKRIGFFTACILWISNLIWYPSIFSLVTVGVFYLINPALVNDKYLMVACIVSLFWLSTFLNYLGIRISSLVSNLSSLLGVIFPTLVLIILAFIWIYTGHHSQITFNKASLLPDIHDINNIAFLISVIISLLGMEMSAVHASDVKNPAHNYPRALFYSAFAILFIMIFSALAIAMVIPSVKIGLVSGLLDAIAIFAHTFQIPLLLTGLIILITLGNFGCASSWMISSTRGMHTACCNNQVAKFLQKTNRFHAPAGVLLLEAIIFTIVSVVYIFMPSVNASYWLLLTLAAQISLIYYVILFVALVKLRSKHPHVTRSFKIPGGYLGVLITAILGGVSAIAAFTVGFIPPQQTYTGTMLTYDLILVGGIIVACVIPILFLIRRSRK